MTNNLVARIDMVSVNEDGTIEIIDVDSFCDYPFRWNYKIYLSFEENLKSIFNLLYSIPPEKYEFTPRFAKFIENRKKLFDEASKKYAKTIFEISRLDISLREKNDIIERIDLEINKLYPYEP